MNDKVIELQNVKKTFSIKDENVDAVKGVSFCLEQGKCLGIIGESGSGKTTVADIIAGFVKADEGKIIYLGKELDLKKTDFKSRQGMQMIFQNPVSSLNPKMKVKMILFEACNYLSSMNKKEKYYRAVEVLKQVNLSENCLEKYPYELSGGECQRVAIARAIMIKPALLICDEITSALDAGVQTQIIKIIRELKKEGIAVLFITHDIALSASVCDEIAVMKDGLILEYGNTADVLHSPSNEYTKKLLKSVVKFSLHR